MGGFFQIGPMPFVGAGLVPEMFSKKGFCMAVLFVLKSLELTFSNLKMDGWYTSFLLECPISGASC